MPHAGQTWGPRSTSRETRGIGGQITCINFVAPKFLSMLKFLTAGSWAQKQKAKGALTPHNRWKTFNSCHQLSSVKFSWQKCLKQLQGHKWAKWIWVEHPKLWLTSLWLLGNQGLVSYQWCTAVCILWDRQLAVAAGRLQVVNPVQGESNLNQVCNLG